MRYLLEQEFLRATRQITRYPIDNTVGFVVGCVFFILLFTGLRLAAAGESTLVETNLSVLVLSYFFWLLTTSCISGVSNDISRDMTTGAIDLMMESPAGLPAVTALRAAAGLVVSAIMSGLLLLVAVLVTGEVPDVGPQLLAPAIAIALQGLALGLIAGALVLRLKQIKVLLTLFTFVLLPVFLLPVGPQISRAWDWLLPVVVLKRRVAGGSWDAAVDPALLAVSLLLFGAAYAILAASVRAVTRSGSARDV